VNFQQFKELRYSIPAGDCPWNPMGFNNDYTEGKYSEMSAHLPLLQYFASQCDVVTEFGTRNANSTCAFLAGARKKVVSYDIQPTPSVIELLTMKDLPCEWEFFSTNTLDPNLYIEDTDFLFIDTLHTYAQVKGELSKHGDKVNKWIGFHDVYSQGMGSLDIPGQEGINRAIKEFMDEKGEWKPIYQVPFNHGLLIIERIGG
jgi:hypothetical protein